MLTRHTIAYGFARGAPGAIVFIGIAVFSRLLDPEQYGIYALALAGIRFAHVLLFQWLSIGLIRFWSIVSDKARLQEAVGNLGVAVTALTCIGGGMASLLARDAAWSSMIALSTLTTCLFGWFELALQEARAALNPQRYGLLSLVRASMWIGFGALLAHLGWGARGPVMGLAAGLFLGCALGGTFRRGRVGRPVIDRKIMAPILRYGIPLSGTFVLGYVIALSDRFILAALEGEAAAGLYAAGYDLPRQVLAMIFSVVNLGAFPLALKAFDEGGALDAREQLARNAILTAGLAVPAAAGLAILGRPIAAVVLGDAFVEAGSALIPWVAFASLAEGMKAQYLDHAFHLKRAVISHLKNVSFIAVLNVALNLLLIPPFGMMGAAYATVLSFTFGIGLTLIQTRAIFPMPVPWDVGRIVLAAALMCIAISPFSSSTGIGSLISAILVGFCVYSVAVYLLDVGTLRGRLVPRRSSEEPRR